jgi:hypothetical protein
MIYNALIYLNRFPTACDQTSMDAMLQNYDRVYFASEPGLMAQRSPSAKCSQYRGTVSLGQMTTHSMFYPIADDTEEDESFASRQEVPAKRYYIPVISVGRRRADSGASSSYYDLGDNWAQIREKFGLDDHYVSPSACFSVN